MLMGRAALVPGSILFEKTAERDAHGHGWEVGQFSVAALYERWNLQKPAVTDRRYKKTK
jgi:hypothetical protein